MDAEWPPLPRRPLVVPTTPSRPSVLSVPAPSPVQVDWERRPNTNWASMWSSIDPSCQSVGGEVDGRVLQPSQIVIVERHASHRPTQSEATFQGQMLLPSGSCLQWSHRYEPTVDEMGLIIVTLHVSVVGGAVAELVHLTGAEFALFTYECRGCGLAGAAALAFLAEVDQVTASDPPHTLRSLGAWSSDLDQVVKEVELRWQPTSSS